MTESRIDPEQVNDGDVVDVQFILGETEVKKSSERFCAHNLEE